jgi:hypothetical protein
MKVPERSKSAAEKLKTNVYTNRKLVSLLGLKKILLDVTAIMS